MTNTTALGVAVNSLICRPRALSSPTRRCWVVTEPCFPLASSSTRGAARALVGPDAPTAVHCCTKGFLLDFRDFQILPQQWRLHLLSWESSPGQGFPSGEGGGLSQDRSLVMKPPGGTMIFTKMQPFEEQDKMIRAGLSITSTLLTARPVVRPSAPCPVCG